MPRVSERYIQERRTEIMRAALRRFARDGFHATTMDDVVAESGLSTSVVYRWFSGKDELVEACVRSSLADIASRVHDELRADPPLPMAEAVRRILLAFAANARDSGIEVSSLPLMYWAESGRNPVIRELATRFYQALRADLTDLVGRHQSAGAIDPELDPGRVGRAVLAFLPGFIVQRRVFDEDETPDSFIAAIALLLPDRTPTP